jgi:hypothetical protein
MRWSNLARSALFSVAICCVIPEAEAVEVFAAPGFAAQADMVTPARYVARGGAAVRGPRGGAAVRGGSVRGGAYRGGAYRGGAYRGGAVYGGGAYRGYGYHGYGAAAVGAAAVGAAAARRCWIDEYGTRVCN